jgi:hypothetical protein
LASFSEAPHASDILKKERRQLRKRDPPALNFF